MKKTDCDQQNCILLKSKNIKCAKLCMMGNRMQNIKHCKKMMSEYLQE
jgi:hypothetical protein